MLELNSHELGQECIPVKDKGGQDGVSDLDLVTLGQLIDALAESIVVINQAGEIVLVNRRTETLFGYSRDVLLGQSLGLLLPERFRQRHARSVQSYFEHPVPRAMGQRRSLFGLRCDGQEFPIEVGLSSLEIGGVLLGLAFVNDITLRKETEDELRRLNAMLEARNEDLDAFTHMVAHDLKGPLALIAGYGDLLLDMYPELDAAALRTYLKRMREGAETMARIIQELLFLASVRREDVTLELLDMGAIVTEVQRRFTFMLEKSGGEIVAPEVWPRAYGHPAWVEEVWANYISNALKYGGAPPKVVLGAAVELDGARVRFWVQDNGVGLAPQAQQALFNKPFTRLEQVRAKGHGLGLSIVARIIQKMGGQVGVASEVGRGSTFSFTLPASP